MAGTVAYLDSSAFVKLVVAEPESVSLKEALLRWPLLASAMLLGVETVRALRRSGNGKYVAKARLLLRSVHMIQLDPSLLDRAGDLDPPDLRSPDAIHLAAALAVGDDVGIMFAYDAGLREAAEAHGIRVDAPV